MLIQKHINIDHNIMTKLDNIRREYCSEALSEKNIAKQPLAQFEQWMEDAIDFGLSDPTAMTIATVDADGQPSQRIVLLKQCDQQGFVFYTNLASKKAQDIQHNNKVSLHFPWHGMNRQVKIQGIVEKVSTTDALKYFASRPFDSKIAAWASHQSSPIDSRSFLLNQFEALKQKFNHGEVPLPDFWGGYRVIPHKYEFWQGGEGRLHDRFEFTLNKESTEWQIQRLAP